MVVFNVETLPNGSGYAVRVERVTGLRRNVLYLARLTHIDPRVHDVTWAIRRAAADMVHAAGGPVFDYPEAE